MSSKKNFFTADEKIYLSELINKYKHLLECKKSDTVSVAQRKKCWQKVADEFNAVAEHSSRTADQLKKCWDNMKTRSKKELSEEKRQRFLTGGGHVEETAPENSVVDGVINTVDVEEPLNTLNAESSIPQTSYCLSEDEEEGPPRPKKRPNRDENLTIKKELESTLKKTETLVEHERELHQLKIVEQNLRIQEARTRLEIAKEVLRQEQLKTEQMLKEYNN